MKSVASIMLPGALGRILRVVGGLGVIAFAGWIIYSDLRNASKAYAAGKTELAKANQVEPVPAERSSPDPDAGQPEPTIPTIFEGPPLGAAKEGTPTEEVITETPAKEPIIQTGLPEELPATEPTEAAAIPSPPKEPVPASPEEPKKPEVERIEVSLTRLLEEVAERTLIGPIPTVTGRGPCLFANYEGFWLVQTLDGKDEQLLQPLFSIAREWEVSKDGKLLAAEFETRDLLQAFRQFDVYRRMQVMLADGVNLNTRILATFKLATGRVQIVDTDPEHTFYPFSVSPDGKWLAASKWSEDSIDAVCFKLDDGNRYTLAPSPRTETVVGWQEDRVIISCAVPDPKAGVSGRMTTKLVSAAPRSRKVFEVSPELICGNRPFLLRDGNALRLYSKSKQVECANARDVIEASGYGGLDENEDARLWHDVTGELQYESAWGAEWVPGSCTSFVFQTGNNEVPLAWFGAATLATEGDLFSAGTWTVEKLIKIPDRKRFKWKWAPHCLLATDGSAQSVEPERSPLWKFIADLEISPEWAVPLGKEASSADLEARKHLAEASAKLADAIEWKTDKWRYFLCVSLAQFESSARNSHHEPCWTLIAEVDPDANKASAGRIMALAQGGFLRGLYVESMKYKRTEGDSLRASELSSKDRQIELMLGGVSLFVGPYVGAIEQSEAANVLNELMQGLDVHKVSESSDDPLDYQRIHKRRDYTIDMMLAEKEFGQTVMVTSASVIARQR